jgi:hypothetical protein
MIPAEYCHPSSDLMEKDPVSKTAHFLEYWTTGKCPKPSDPD